MMDDEPVVESVSYDMKARKMISMPFTVFFRSLGIKRAVDRSRIDF